MVEIDDRCRVSFSQNFQKKLFKKICKENNIKLNSLCKILNINYWTFKGWNSGKYHIPGYVIKKLLTLCSVELQKTIFKTMQIKDYNWGQVKGARVALSHYDKQEIKKRMCYVREFRQIKKLEVRRDENFWELIGILMGDGCISKYFSKYDNQIRYEITITGHIKDDKEYYETFVIPMLNRVFHINPKLRKRPNESVVRIHIRNKQIFQLLRNIGLPVGRKTEKIKFTNEMLKLPPKFKAKIIRGLFDTDGSLSARKDEEYKYPYFKITTQNDKLRKQLKSILKNMKFPAYIHSKDVIVRGKINAIKWMRKIGSSHPIHIKRFNIWLKTCKLLPKYMGS